MVGVINSASNNQIGFGGRKINVVAQLKSSLKRRAAVEVDSWDIKDGKFGRSGYSDGASVCVIGDIQNDKKLGFLYHSFADESLETVKKFLTMADKQLRDKSQKLEGVLVGAMSSQPETLERAEKIMKIYDDLGVNFSALLGFKDGKGSTGLFASAARKKYIVSSCIDMNDKFKPKSIGDLKDRYEIVKQGDGHKFVF